MDGQIRKRPIGEPLAEAMRIWREANPNVVLTIEQMIALRRSLALKQKITGEQHEQCTATRN